MSETNASILLVDDDKTITDFLSYGLRENGYEVDVASDGNTALDMATKNPYDLVILDVMLPGMDGYEVCRHIRAANATMPVLFLSARDTDLDTVVGLEIGGDDYLTKPVRMRVLLARIKALLRRSSQTEAAQVSSADEILEVSGIRLDEATHTADSDAGPIDLTPREFELLATLMQHAGKVMSRDDLLHEAWGWEYLVVTKTVDTHVKRLRDKLTEAGVDPSLIETVRGYGYRFKVV